MSRPLIIFITETADELKQLMNTQQKVKLKERVQALYLLKNERTKTLQDLVDFLGRSKSTIESWLTLYRKKGLLGLLAWNYHGGLDHRLGHVPPTDTELWAVPTLQKLGNQQLGFVGWALPTKRWPKR